MHFHLDVAGIMAVAPAMFFMMDRFLKLSLKVVMTYDLEIKWLKKAVISWYGQLFDFFLKSYTFLLKLALLNVTMCPERKKLFNKIFKKCCENACFMLFKISHQCKIFRLLMNYKVNYFIPVFAKCQEQDYFQMQSPLQQSVFFCNSTDIFSV